MMRVFANLWNEITNCLRNDIQKNESASTTHARRVWKHGIFFDDEDGWALAVFEASERIPCFKGIMIVFLCLLYG